MCSSEGAEAAAGEATSTVGLAAPEVELDEAEAEAEAEAEEEQPWASTRAAEASAEGAAVPMRPPVRELRTMGRTTVWRCV